MRVAVRTTPHGIKGLAVVLLFPDKYFLKPFDFINTLLITNEYLPNIILVVQIFHQGHHGKDDDPLFSAVIILVYSPFNLICSVHFVATAFVCLFFYDWCVLAVYCSTSMLALDCYIIW